MVEPRFRSYVILTKLAILSELLSPCEQHCRFDPSTTMGKLCCIISTVAEDDSAQLLYRELILGIR
jgi:hypothetical protein